MRTRYDREYDEAMEYFRYAVWHNWTPEQVDALPIIARRTFPILHQIVDQLEREQRQKQEAAARMQRQLGR